MRSIAPALLISSVSAALSLCTGSGAAHAGAVQPTAASSDTPLIPRDVLFGNPERANVQISPDGSLISYLAPLDGVLNVWAMSSSGGEPFAITRSVERPIRSYGWAWNGEQVLYVQDRGGDENTSVYAVDVISGEEIDLTPEAAAQASILSTHRDRPDEILVMLNDRDPRFRDVLKIDTRTGERDRIVINDEGWVGFVPDDEWQILGRVKMTETGGLRAEMRDADVSEWYGFLDVPMEDSGNFGILGLSQSGDTVYLTDPSGRDTSALVAVAPGPDGGSQRRTLFESDRSDVADVLINPETNQPEAVAVNRLRKEWTVLDDAVRGDFDRLARLDRGDFEILDRSRDDRTWIVAYLRSDGPVRYWTWDRDAGEGTFLFTSRPALEGQPLVAMQALEVPTRDGLSMPSYLTRPRGATAATPMVLFVHGGPWARDQWGWNPYHQWMANRGYAVLSVNFRGSSGFGKSFLNAGNREWYAKMQDDLVDAVNWAVGEGIADAEKVAIMGGSYGGYATLAGLTRDPGLFACGVDIVGPSHVATLLGTIPPYWEPLKVMFETRVGAMSETEFLDSISPLTHVDRISDPLLIGQGANDPRVKISESDQIVAAMQERGIPVTYVVFPDEGHGFARPENNTAFNAVVETFLARHLGGRAEPVGGDLEASTADIRAVGDLDLPATGGAATDRAPAAPVTAGEVTLEDLPEGRRAQSQAAVDRMRQQVAEDPSAKARLGMIVGLLEAQAASGSPEDQIVGRYVVQELRKILDGAG